MPEGVQSVAFYPGLLPSGTYFCPLRFEPLRDEGSPTVPAFVQMRRMLLIRMEWIDM
jgi:hypothetical protein